MLFSLLRLYFFDFGRATFFGAGRLDAKILRYLFLRTYEDAN